MKPISIRFLMAVFAISAGLHAAAARAEWRIIDLGALGDRGSIALALNNRGEVGGYSASAAPGPFGNPYHAFVWKDGVMTDLGGDLGDPPGSAYSSVNAMNAKGTMAGFDSTGKVYLWRKGVRSTLPLPFNASARGINNRESVVGVASTPDGDRAFLHSRGGTAILDTGSGVGSYANALNDRETVVGAILYADYHYRAVAWHNGAATDLGTLGGGTSVATDINSAGTIVGHSFDASGMTLPFIRDASGMRRLFQAPVQHSAYATSINNSGAVIGDIDFNSFLYEGGVLTFLEDIPAVRAAGWTRLFAMKIADNGAIAGWGWRSGTSPPDGQAFLLTR